MWLIYDRGFGKYVGARIEERLEKPCFEVLSNAEFHGEYTDLRFPVYTGKVYDKQNVFKVSADRNAIALSNFADADLRNISPATIYFENSLGGTVVSFA